MADGDWHEAKVTLNQPAAQGLVHLGLDVEGTPIAGGHRFAGQYVKLALGDAVGFFAIASAPGDGHRFEFLIKSGSTLSDALSALPPGARVRISEPSGKGFPLEKARGRAVL